MNQWIVRAAWIGVLAASSAVSQQPAVPAAPAAVAAPAATQPPDVKIDTVNVAPGIYMLVGRGGNIGLTVGVDGAAIIDDQFADMEPKIRAAVAHAQSDKPVSS